MNFLKNSVLAAIGFFLFATTALLAQDYVDNALYIRLKEGSSVSAKSFGRDIVPLKALQLKISDKELTQNGFHREAASMSLFNNSELDRTFRIQFDSTKRMQRIIRLLQKDPNVELVEKVPMFRILSANTAKAVPNDPYYAPFEGKNLQWYLKMINAEEAWALQEGDPNIRVAVVDGAVWGEHPDLDIPKNLQYDACSGDVGNSKPDYSPQNYLCETLTPTGYTDPCPIYTWSHGTHCAGVVGAKNNNGIGIASLASGVTLMGVKATTRNYHEYVVAGYEGIRWAAANGANVISCSWGTGSGGSDVGNSLLRTCYDNNIVIVTAAGNENLDSRGDPSASMYVITVGSVDESKSKSSFSNYGNWVDILAPGGSASAENGRLGIFSTTYCFGQSIRLLRGISEFDDKPFDEMVGTSMATPLVASLCGLMLSRDSTLTPAQIKDIMQNTSTDIRSRFFTPLAGIINAEEAIKAIDNKKFDAPVENLKVSRIRSDTTWITWDAPKDPAHAIVGYRVFCNGNIVDTCTKETSGQYYPMPSGQNVFLVSALYEDDFVSPRKEVRAITPNLIQLSVAANPKDGGTVTGAGNYVLNARATLSATPNEGYKFLHWKKVGNGAILSTNPQYTFSVTEKGTYVAFFESDGTANEQTENLSFSLTPNPARDQVKISSPIAIDRISVLDLQGRTLKQIDRVNATEWTLDVQNLENGTYIISLQTTQGNLQQKFVKL